VKVLDGTFTGTEGTVLESPRYARYGLVLVALPVLGQVVPVELEPT
jgi:hypothetical protein